MIIYGYIIEILIFLSWYNLIIKKEIKERKIFIKSFKMLNIHKRLIIKSVLSLVQYNKEGKEFLINIKNSILKLSYVLVGLSVYALLGPIFLPIIIQKISKGPGGYIFYTIFLAALLIGKLKAETQKIVKVLIDYKYNVIRPIENNPDIIVGSIEEIKEINLDKRKKILFVIAIIVSISVPLGWYKFQEKFQENLAFRCISIAVFIIILVHEYVKEIKRKKDVLDSGIKFDSHEYDQFEESIKDMCKKLKIENLKCGIWEDDGVNAEAVINKNGLPEINITTGFICTLIDLYNKKEISDTRAIFEVTIAHELAHIHYKDHKNVRSRLRMCSLLCLANLVAAMLSVLLLRYSQVFIAITIMLFFIEWVLGKVMCDIRYWEQIAELKADRLGVTLCNGGKEAFIEFWGREKTRKRETKKIESLNNSNILYRFYKRYIENEAHPSIERRLELVNRRGDWKWWEYFEHALIIHKWKISRRGWNGR